MAQLIGWPDPRNATLALLRAAVPGPTYGTKDPDEFPDDAKPARPYVKVSVDAEYQTNQALTVTTVRVGVWGADDFTGYALARQLHSALLAYGGGADVRSFGPLTGPVPTQDPDTGEPLCAFTVAARLRPMT